MKLKIKHTPPVLKPLIKTIQEILKHVEHAQLFLVASSLSFTTVLSIVPVMAVSFAVFRAFGGMERIYETVEPFILSHLAESAGKEAIEALHHMVEQANAGTLGLGGLIALVVTSMSMLSSVETAINRIWHAPSTRGVLQRVSTYWLFITFGPIALAVAVGFAARSSDLGRGLGLSQLLPTGSGMLILVTAVLFFVYKWVPNAEVRARYALISAALGSVLWNLARWGYAIYTREAVQNSKIYGSLSAIPVLMIWIYLVWLIVLTGAAVTAALQKIGDGRK